MVIMMHSLHERNKFCHIYFTLFGYTCIYVLCILFITDNLLKARGKASVAENTSDLASDLDSKRIPKEKKNLYNTNETQSALSESSSDSEVAAPVQFPVLREYTVFFI